MNKSTFDLILLIVFLAIVFFAIIAGLIGLMKGVYKTTLKTILKAILIMVLIFTAPSISYWIGNIDMGKLYGIPGDNGTLLSALVNYLNQTGAISPMNGMSLYETTIAIATSALCFVTFLVGMILIQLTISLITAIFYHGIFRWFLPVETKRDRTQKKLLKNTKCPNKETLTQGLLDSNGKAPTKVRKKLPLLRVPGGIIGLAQEFVFLCVLVSPVTALARIAVDNKSTVQEGLKASGLTDEQQKMTNDIIDSTENSLLYKTLGFSDFDLTILNKVSTVTLNNMEVSFSGLVSSTLDIADPLLKDGIISYDQAASTVTVNFSSLLAVTTVDSLINNLIDSPMIMALIPPLVDVALNSVNGASFAIDELDFNNIDWSSELTILNGIYKEVYSSAIEPIVTPSGIDPKNFKIATSTMTDDEMNTYINAISKLGTMSSIKKNLPVILSGIGRYLENQGFEILPSDKAAYNDIDWSQDLKVFAESAFNYFKTIGMDISSDFNPNVLQEKTFDVMKDPVKREKLENIICGQTNHQGLLDTQLFSTLSLSKIISSTLSSIPSIKKYANNLSLSFIDDFSKNELKSEFSTMFSIAGIVFDDNSKVNINNLSSIDIGDSETASELADLLHKSKSSKIFEKLYPSVMKGILFNSNIDFTSYLYGLTPYNFNYDSKTYIDDFESILRLMPQIQEMQKLFSSDVTNAEKVEKLDTSLLRSLLNLIVNSDFFNADQKTGINSYTQKNVNIATFFTNLFKEEPFASMNLVAPTIDDLQSVSWGTGVGGDKGEIDLICTMIEEGKNNPEFLTTFDFDKIQNSTAVGNMIKCGFESKFLSPSILSIIDSSLNQYLNDIGIPYSMNEMRNAMWIDDSDEIAELLSLLKGVDLKNFDLNTFSPDRLNAMLTVLSKMNLVKTGSKEKDPFGYAIYSLMKKQGLFSNMGVDVDSTLFELDDSASWSIQTGEISLDGTENKHTITTKGEIAYFSDFFREIQKAGFDTLKEGKIPSGFVSSLSEPMNSTILRKMIVFVLQNTLNTISMPAGYENIIKSIDLNILLTLDHEAFMKEFQIFENLYLLSSEKIGSDTKLNLMLDSFFTLSTIDVGNGRTLEDDMDDLITSLTTSALFTTRKEGAALNPISELLSVALEKMTLAKKITMVSDDALVKDSLYGVLNSVLDWQTEGVNFISIVNQMQGMDGSKLNIVGAKITKEKATTLFSIMNRSPIFHRVPIALFEDGFTEKGITDFLKDPDTGKVDYPLNFRVHLSASKEDVEFWDNEIRNGIELALGEGGLKSLFDSTTGTIADVKFDTINVKSLYYLGKMKIFENSRSYLMYNMINLYSTADFSAPSLFLKGVGTPYGVNEKVYRFENLFFKNPKLLNANGELDKEKAMKDLNLVNQILHASLEAAPSAINSTSLKDVDVDFISLTESCYRFDGDTFYRSDFASEILAGIETKMMKSSNYATYFALLADTDFYADDYRMINLVEARSLNGFLAFAKLETDKFMSTVPYYSKAKLTPVFSLFGENDASKVTQTSYQHFIAYSEYQATHNSLLAMKAKDVIIKIPTLKDDSSTVNSLEKFTTLTLDSTSFSAYLESATIA
ncbi:MAG: hypothetical protein SOR23_01870 [Candidatus Enterosoma sp.]|nr:hypothetical protein [Bacilli bacterium]MDY3046978.1 hypothetical protein [Candidatus Enterosoma sp.]